MNLEAVPRTQREIHEREKGDVMAKRHSRPAAEYRYEHYDPRV